MAKRIYNGGKNTYSEKKSEGYGDNYDSVDFNLNTGETNYNTKANVPGAFDKIKNMHSVTIKSNKNVSIKLNSILNPAISLSGANKTLKISSEIGFEVTNIFITNSSGAVANIKIMGN